MPLLQSAYEKGLSVPEERKKFLDSITISSFHSTCIFTGHLPRRTERSETSLP